MNEITKESLKTTISNMSKCFNETLTAEEKAEKEKRADIINEHINKTIAGIIELIDSPCCCRDISGYIVRQCIKKEEILIDDNYYTPNFGTHKDWLAIYSGLKYSQYGGFSKFIDALNNLALRNNGA